MKKLFSFIVVSFFAFLPFSAKAFCPVCVVAVGAGLGFSRWLGIDDSIVGVWIGGLTVALIGWNLGWFIKKKINFKGRTIITISAYYLLLVLPLFFIKDVWHPLNTLWGINKLLWGIVLGSLFFYGAGAWYQYLKRKNNNRAHFPYQKVVMPVLALALVSLFFYFITK